MPNIKTRFYNDVDTDHPLNEYPRPQFVRDNWTNLNGYYDYAITSEDETFPDEYDGKILVPFAIESQLSGVEKTLTPNSRLWYRRTFRVGREFRGKRALLHLDAVDWECHVFVNRNLVAFHRGGYTVVTADITDSLIKGDNELIVCVYDPTDLGWQQKGKQTLTPSGIYYTATSGIWQTVWLEAVNKTRIKSIRLTPDIDAGIIKIQPKVKNAAKYLINTEISFNGEKIVETVINGETNIAIPDAKLWSPETPNLYDIKLELVHGGRVVDTVKSYFGMRKFSMEPDDAGIMRLCLNNKPYFQKGLLDQGYWPDSGMTPPTDEAMIYDIQKMKDLGYNMLRKHIKVEPARWYYHCDRLGMLVWQDMVSGGENVSMFYRGVLPNVITALGHYKHIMFKDNKYKILRRETKESRDFFEKELFEVIDQLYNTVSINVWVIFNEAWGQFDSERISRSVKAYDPTRNVDHASGWYDQGAGDFKSVHQYVLRVEMPKDKWKKRRAFVLSEYGGYSTVCSGHCWNEKKGFGYISYKSKAEISDAYRKLHEEQLIPLIPKGLSATVYTQVSDVENELNGIMTYDRELVKLDEDVIRDVNRRLSY